MKYWRFEMKKLILSLLVLFGFMTNVANAVFEDDLVFTLNAGTQTEMNAITPSLGMMIYNTTDKKIYYHNGTNWATMNTLFISSDSDNKIVTGTDGGISYTPSAPVIAKTSNYTLQQSDNGAVFTFNSTNDVTLTVPAGLPVGFNVSVYQIGNGKVTIFGSGAVVIKNRLSRFKTAGKDAGVGIVCTATNIFHLTGDLKK